MIRARAKSIGAPDMAAVLSVLAAVWYAVFSLQRQRLHREGLDLGIFGQAIRNLADFQAPISHIKGVDFNLFGDHFHPIIVLAVPFYWMHDNVQALLVAQAFAVALSVAIVCRCAQRQLGEVPGLAVGFAYAIAWGLQSALAFDFHEVALGVPIMAGAAAAYVEDRWHAAYVWSALLLLVKEDLAFTVIAFGAYLALRGRARAGTWLAAGAAAWFALVVFVVVPALSPYDRYTYWSSDDIPVSPIHPHQTDFDLSSALFVGEKWWTLFLLLAPVLFLALLSPLSIAVLPTLGWRFLSGNESYWGTEFHYSAILMPLLFIAAVDGLVRLSRRMRGRLPPRWPVRIASLAMVGVALGLSTQFKFWQATSPSWWGTCPRCPAAAEATATIPDGATVAADTLLMPELVDRADVFLISPDFTDSTGRPFTVDYVLLDEQHGNLWPQPHWVEELRIELAGRDFRPIFERSGYVVFHRARPAGAG